MVCHVAGCLQISAMFKESGDAGGSEGVAADALGRAPGLKAAALDHRIDIAAAIAAFGEGFGLAVAISEQRSVGFIHDPTLLHVGDQRIGGLVVEQHVMDPAAFLMKPD